MKQIVIAILAISAVTFAACNNNANQTSEKKDSMSHDHMTMDSTGIASNETVNAPVIRLHSPT